MWVFDDPATQNVLKAAPCSHWGVVVSQDGQKQDNTIHTAIEQLAYAFFPYIESYLSLAAQEMSSKREDPNVALIPVIVTNATLFRLRPTVNDLSALREASAPSDIADRLRWTWCYRPAPSALARYNQPLRKDLITRFGRVFPPLQADLEGFERRPAWFAVVNLDSLPTFLEVLSTVFARSIGQPVR